MNKTRISKLEQDTQLLYEDFLERCPHALFYHSIRYKNFLKELLGCEECYLLLENHGRVEAALPLMSKRFSQGLVMNSLPYFGSHGSILYLQEDAANSLVHEYNNLAANKELISSTVIANPFAPISEFSFMHNYNDYRIGQFTLLPSGKEEEKIRNHLLSMFESSTRRNINKAVHANIQVGVDNNAIDKLEQLHQENITGKGGLCKSETFFDLIPKHFRPHQDYNIFTATLEGEMIAALLVFYFKNSVEYFTPGINEEMRQLQPLALIIYEAMVEASKRGYTIWNWGGTWESQDGVFKFKKKWGSLSKNYRYFTQLNLETLREKKASDLLADFPNFYVLPFSHLLQVTQV